MGTYPVHASTEGGAGVELPKPDMRRDGSGAELSRANCHRRLTHCNVTCPRFAKFGIVEDSVRRTRALLFLRFCPRCHYALAMMIFFNSKVSCLADYRRNLRRKGFAGIHCVLSMMFRSFR